MYIRIYIHSSIIYDIVLNHYVIIMCFWLLKSLLFMIKPRKTPHFYGVNHPSSRLSSCAYCRTSGFRKLQHLRSLTSKKVMFTGKPLGGSGNDKKSWENDWNIIGRLDNNRNMMFNFWQMRGFQWCSAVILGSGNFVAESSCFPTSKHLQNPQGGVNFSLIKYHRG